MNYVKKHLRKVNFCGIEYRKIKNVDDYFVLEQEVTSVLSVRDKRQTLIDLENLKNQSVEDKDISMSVNFPLASAIAFGIASLVFGIFFGMDKGLISFLEEYFCLVVIVFLVVVCPLIIRTRQILELRNKKIVFYDTLCRMVKGKG